MKVEVVLRILPQSPEANIEKMEREIKEKIFPEKIEKEPIAFGLFAIKISKVIEDKEGELERIENEIKSIEDVGRCEVISVTRLLA